MLLYLVIFINYSSNIRLQRNSSRKSRGLVEAATCPFCGWEDEFNLHALQSCTRVKHIWEKVDKQDHHFFFLSFFSLRDWLENSITDDSCIRNNMQQSMLLGL